MVKLQKKKTGGFSFSVLTPSGNLLMKSIGFDTKDDAEKAITELSKIVGSRASFERRTEHSGQFAFSLKNSHGKLIGKSGCYTSEAGMENGIKNLRESVLMVQPSN